MHPDAPDAADAPDAPDEPGAIVRSYLTRLLVDRDPAVCDELLAEDYVDHDAPVGTPPGPGATRAYVARMLDDHPDLGFRIEHLVADGEAVAVYATWHALGLAGLLLVTVVDGRLRTRRSTYWKTKPARTLPPATDTMAR